MGKLIDKLVLRFSSKKDNAHNKKNITISGDNNQINLGQDDQEFNARLSDLSASFSGVIDEMALERKKRKAGDAALAERMDELERRIEVAEEVLYNHNLKIERKK